MLYDAPHKQILGCGDCALQGPQGRGVYVSVCEREREDLRPLKWKSISGLKLRRFDYEFVIECSGAFVYSLVRREL